MIVGLAWVVITGLLARSRLEDARTDLARYGSALASGNIEQAHRIGARVVGNTGSAHQLTSGPAWWVGSHLLVAGTPLRTTREIAYQVDVLSHGTVPRLPGLVHEVVDRRRGASTGNIDVAALQRAGGTLTQIRSLVRSTETHVRSTPPSWFGPVTAGRQSFVDKLGKIDDALGLAGRTVHTVAPMLGADRPQRYFIGFMNEAESRSIGGLPGSFAIVTINHGTVSFEHFGSDVELHDVRAKVDLGEQYQRLYGQYDPTGVIQNSDIGPQFPDAARIWAGMWQAKSGQHVDGALALDPTALGYLMRVAGPAHLPGGIAVTANNVAGLTQSRQYTLYPGFGARQTAERKQFLVSIAQAVSAKLLRVGSPADLLTPLRQAVRERRIAVWSDVASRERAIVSAGLGGVLRAGDDPLSTFYVNNATGGKLDFYLHRSMTYRATGCGDDRTATASFTLSNETPSYRLPVYVTYVAGGRPAGAAPGFNRLIVTYYATPGSRVRSVTLDGRPQRVESMTEDGLTSVRLLVDLPAGSSRTVRVVTDEPARRGKVRVVTQPLVHGMQVRTHVPDCTEPATAVPSGPASTGSVWPSILVGLGALLVVLLLAGRFCASSARGGFRRARTAVDTVRSRSIERAAHGGAPAAAVLIAVLGIAGTLAVTVLLGLLTKTSAVIRLDRPVYRFFLEHRASWLTHPMAVFTHVGEYQQTTAITLAAALVIGTGLVRRHLVGLLVWAALAAALTWPFVSLGRLYDYTAAIALIGFVVLAVLRPVARNRWVVAAVLAAVVLVEKRVQVLAAEAVHGSVPPLTEAYAQVGPFPSGGCTRIVLAAGLVAVLFAREYRNRHASTALALVAAAVCTAEGFSRIYLGKHWFVDCLGGFVLGAGLLVTLAAALRCYLGPDGDVTAGPARGTSDRSAQPAGR